MDNDEERRKRARQIAEVRYGFLWHLPIYIIVNLGLVAIWYYSGAASRGRSFPSSSGDWAYSLTTCPPTGVPARAG